MVYRPVAPAIKNHWMPRGTPLDAECRQLTIRVPNLLGECEMVIVATVAGLLPIRRFLVPARKDNEMVPTRIGIDENLFAAMPILVAQDRTTRDVEQHTGVGQDVAHRFQRQTVA